MADKTITDLQLISSITDDANFAVDDGTQTKRTTPQQLFNYLRPKMSPGPDTLENIGIATSVGSSALTIALKTNAGSDATTTDKIRVSFRSATLTNGGFNLREVSAALSLVISSGSTLGQVSGQPSRIWVYLIDNAGTPELAVSHKKYREDALVSTTAEGGAGGADSATVIYSTTSRSNVPIRLIGYIDNTQTTAGTWASAGTQIQLAPFVENKNTAATLITAPGSGTFYVTPGCTRLRVRLVGGGGGGRGSGTTGLGSGSNGQNTTFGTSLLTGNGGIGATSKAGGAGGSGSGIGVTGIAITGGAGAGAHGASITGIYAAGSRGGNTPFGAGGQSAGFGDQGAAGTANTGAGGQGGGISNTVNQETGSGGGGGGYVEAWIIDPLASYSYTVGDGGAGGSAGTSGVAGGGGATGVIEITEYFN